jgi:hypothetical protein
MEKENLIPVDDFCHYHHVAISFIHTLEDTGLIETVTVEATQYLEPEKLGALEKYTRLHQELEIHPEDLDVVSGLLERLEALQQKLNELQGQVRFYEQLGE